MFIGESKTDTAHRAHAFVCIEPLAGPYAVEFQRRLRVDVLRGGLFPKKGCLVAPVRHHANQRFGAEHLLP